MKNQAKLIIGSVPSVVESEINDFLNQLFNSNQELIDIKFNADPIDDQSELYFALIIYGSRE